MRFSHIALLLALALPGAANQTPPIGIRVCMQLIEVPHATFTSLMSGKENSGPALHAKVLGMTKSGKAKLVETCLVTTRSGHKATIESIREEIYPTDYESLDLPANLGNTPDLFRFPSTALVRPLDAIAFETRNTGITLEVEPTVDFQSKQIDLRFAQETVDLEELVTWTEHQDRWGDASIKRPIFETWKTNTAITLQSGKIELANVFSPKPADAQSTATRKILCFVRADIVEP